LERLETPGFASKTRFIDPKTGTYFQTIFAKFLRVQKDRIFPNFSNQTIPKLAKTKSSENSVFCRALL